MAKQRFVTDWRGANVLGGVLMYLAKEYGIGSDSASDAPEVMAFNLCKDKIGELVKGQPDA